MEIIHFHFETLVSTNDWAKEHMASFAQDKITLITADKQTGARGRYGRKWVSPPKLNLCASFCFFLEEPEGLDLTHLMALSVVKILEKRGLEPKIKWPNDILVQWKKIAGILCETLLLGDQTGVIVGIGLNTNVDREFLDTIDQPATSLLLESGQQTEIPDLLRELQESFTQDLLDYQERGPSSLQTHLQKYLLPKTFA